MNARLARKSSEPERDPEFAKADEADGQRAVNDTEARYGSNESPCRPPESPWTLWRVFAGPARNSRRRSRSDARWGWSRRYRKRANGKSF